MGRGKRFNDEPKLNFKKVFAVIIALVVIIMFVLIIRNVLKKTVKSEKIAQKYFTVYADNKWGVINQYGEYVIMPSYENMIIIPNENKDVFLCMYDINDTEGTYKTKAINKKNNEIFDEYSQVEEISNFDNYGNLYYFENILKVCKDGKYGLIDFDGNIVLNIEYDSLNALKGEDTILVVKEGKVGAADKYGKLSLPPNFTNVKMTGNGLFIVEEENVKVIDNSGNTVIQDGFDKVSQILSYDTKGIVFVKDNKYGVMNINGEKILNNEYDYLKQVKENVYIAKNEELYGVISNLGEKLLDFNYKNLSYSKVADMYIADVSETESKIFDNNFQEKMTGIVNVNEEKGFFKIRINDEYKYYDFNFVEKTNMDVLINNDYFVSKQNGKYGFIDKNGKVVVDYIYDDVMEQNEYGYAAVKQNGLWGSIDKSGKVIIEPKYNLDDNIKIDFIGKWHLGRYIEMNYYTDQ